jgi:hypothetical protein
MDALTSEQTKLIEAIVARSNMEIFNVQFWKATLEQNPILQSFTPQKLMNIGIQARLYLIKDKDRPQACQSIDLSEISSASLLHTIPVQAYQAPEQTYVIQFSGNKRTFSKTDKYSQYRSIDKKVNDICIKYKVAKKEVLQRMIGHNGDINQVLLSFHDPAIQQKVWTEEDDSNLRNLYSKRTMTEFKERAAFLEIRVSK